MKKLLATFALCGVAATLLAPAFAATNVPKAIQPTSQTDANGITIYKDAAGGSVLHGLPQVDPNGLQVPSNKQAKKSAKGEAKIPTDIMIPNDTETNPILIGYWNPGDCGSGISDTYARHTIGTQDVSSYFLAYGDASWYNSSGNVALPYKNGTSSISPGTDVANGISFSIRDMGTNNALTITRTDFGPNQCPGSVYAGRIVDLDTASFKTMHGNTTDGTFYCRTWVPYTTWDPS